MPKSVAPFWIDLLSHLKGGGNCVLFIPPTAHAEPGAHQRLCLAGGGGVSGRPVHLAAGAETPGHVENGMFTAHHKYFSFLLALLFFLYNYAVLSDISGIFETSPVGSAHLM